MMVVAAARPRRGWRDRARLLDLGLGLAMAAVAVGSVFTPDARYTFRDPNVWAVLLALTGSLPLIVRRRWPLAVVALITSATFVGLALRLNAPGLVFCEMFALYAVAAWHDLRRAVLGLALAFVAMGGFVIMRAPYFDSPWALLNTAAMTATWGIGRFVRDQRRAADAAIDAAVTAERQRAVASERAVFAERLRIARDLHDVVAHALSVISVQAGVARYQLTHRDGVSSDMSTDATSAGTALAAIEQASRAALSDLRRMVGLLRESSPSTSAEPSVPPIAMGVATASPPRTGLVREGVVDVIMASSLAALSIANTLTPPATAVVYRRPDVPLVLLTLAASLPLAVRRRWPLPVLLVSTLASLTISLGGWNPDLPALCTYVALYTVAVWRPFYYSVAWTACVLIAQGLAALVGAPHLVYGNDLAGVSVLVPLGLGLFVRRWRRLRGESIERVLAAEATRAIAAERAVLAERMRIAWELHKVVAETLSVIAVQSEIGRRALADRAPVDSAPEGAALSAIEQASRLALDDLRRMLDALHAGPDGPDPGLVPSPGLVELQFLASAHRAAHGPVELTVDPTVESAPESLRVTAYRLVQEGLTNVRKHAAGAAVDVRVYAEGDDVVVQIDDSGGLDSDVARRVLPPYATGFGLVGMRERVGLYGGTLVAQRGTHGGFSVRAVLRRDVPEPSR